MTDEIILRRYGKQRRIAAAVSSVRSIPSGDATTNNARGQTAPRGS
nr:hypothetical protein [uncultured Campylobacter sp.]